MIHSESFTSKINFTNSSYGSRYDRKALYCKATQLSEWNQFYVENIEGILSNPFVYFQEIQFKDNPYEIDFKRFNHFVASNYPGTYPDIQIYNFFAFLYAIKFFPTMTHFKSWKNKKRLLFEDRSYDELIYEPNGINYIKARLMQLEVCNL